MRPTRTTLPRWLRARPHRPGPASGTEFGWRVHAAQEAWTAKVDVKASIVLALAGASLAVVIAGQADSGPFADLHGWRLMAYHGAMVAGVLAVLLSIFTIYPMLGTRHRPVNMETCDLIYFGHLRHLREADIAARLDSLTAHSETQALARQLRAMASRNWRKHRLLQAALWMLGVSFVGLAIVATWT